MAGKSDRDMVVEIHTAMGFMKENTATAIGRLERHEGNFENYQGIINKRLASLEKRIASNEKYIYMAVGGAAVISALINWVM